LDRAYVEGGSFVNAGERDLVRRLDAYLIRFSAEHRRLPGIEEERFRKVLVRQLVDSERRVRFVLTIRDRDISELRADPESEIFDPLRAAALKMRGGERDEAYWLIFLATHFGKSARSGWRLVRDVYRGAGGQEIWTWARTSNRPRAFRAWLAAHEQALKRDGVPRLFGNHRKYETLAAWAPNGTGAAVESYVAWVTPPRMHDELIQQAISDAKGNGRKAFDILYRSMRCVARFGRTARFDYLTMIGKIGLAPLEAGSTYMTGATGPRSGALLLFQGNADGQTRARDLDQWLVELEAALDLGPQGMQVLEDALCNWQKSPAAYKAFRG
jgi:hypothetical protein